MTGFTESFLDTVTGPAVSAEQKSRPHPRANKLLRALAGKKNILVTTHQHPDPDALASSLALTVLLRTKLNDAKVTNSVKGDIGGGINAAFVQHAPMDLAPWSDEKLSEYDAVVLIDVQPAFRYSPLPAGVTPTAVIDHHRARGRKPRCPFCDIRTDVGASSSIVFSYFMELDVQISPELAATLLFAIETDVAGAAGQPGELDNVALSGLTVRADTRKLYKMRYVDLPQSYYAAYATGMANAVQYENLLISHLDRVSSMEVPAVIADFLLRYDQVQWVLMTAVSGAGLALSVRTQSNKMSAAEVMRRLIRNIGEGGGHRTKAGGHVPLPSATTAEIEKVRARLRRRFLRALGVAPSRGTRLITPVNTQSP